MQRIDIRTPAPTAVNSNHFLTCSNAGTWKLGVAGEWKTAAGQVAVAYVSVRSRGIGRSVFTRPRGLPPHCPPSSAGLEPSLQGAEPCLGKESPRNDTQQLS